MSTKNIRNFLFNLFSEKKTTGAVTVLNESVLLVNKTSGEASSVVLPAANPLYGRRAMLVVDSKGDAATNNVTVTVAGGGTIAGASSLVISQNYGSALLLDVGDEWQQVATSTTAALALTQSLTVTPTQTLASATSLTYKGVSVPATTLTLTGTTAVTTATGLNLIEVGRPTYTDASAVTVTNGATLYIANSPLAAGSLTLTNAYSLWVDAGAVRFDGDVDMSATASDLLLKTNTAAALEVSDGTTKLLAFDTRNTVTAVVAAKFSSSAPTIASATGDTYSQVGIAAVTVTLSGTTLVTALDGLGLTIGSPTVTDSMACTVTTLSNLYVALPVAAGSVTGTNIYTAHFAGAVLIDGNINVAAQATTLTAKANTAATFVISDGTTSIVSVDSRNTIAAVAAFTVTGSPPTIASVGSAILWNQIKSPAVTVTLSGTTTTTSLLGVGGYFGIPTITNSMACTLTTVSTLHVSAVATAGGMMTLTNRRMISTDVSDCFLTNAGVWTDTACWAWGKNAIVDATRSAIEKVVDQLTPRAWTYRDDAHGRDYGRERVGIVYDELPDELRAPGEKTGVSAGLLSSFGLAAIKCLWDENRQLHQRLERLEAALNA